MWVCLIWWVTVAVDSSMLHLFAGVLTLCQASPSPPEPKASNHASAFDPPEAVAPSLLN